MSADTPHAILAKRPQYSAGQKRKGNPAQTAAAGIDYQLIGVVITMVLFGLMMVFSASFPAAGTYYFLRQLTWVGLGGVVFIGVAALPCSFWRKAATPIMILTIIGLVSVLVLGKIVFGATRHLLSGSYQPSEIAKLSLTIYLAAWVAGRGKKLARVEEGLLPFALMMALIGGLIVAENSFSVAIITLTIGLTIYFIGGGKLQHIGVLFLLGVPVLAIAMSQAEYPFERIRMWYDVWFNPAEAPQDLVKLMWMLREGRGAIADPNLWTLKATVTGLWNDYLFANIGADLHLPGTLLVVLLYVWFGYRALTIAVNAPDRFGALTAIGLATWILVQAMIHIGTSLTLIPPTGQPLPFMSYGGSSLIACLAAAGVLVGISRAQKERKALYAHFAFGWGDGRTRLPAPGRRGSAKHDDRGQDRQGFDRKRPAARRRTATPRASRRPLAGPGNDRPPGRGR